MMGLDRIFPIDFFRDHCTNLTNQKTVGVQPSCDAFSADADGFFALTPIMANKSQSPLITSLREFICGFLYLGSISSIIRGNISIMFCVTAKL